MCRITGFLDFPTGLGQSELLHTVASMNNTLQHREPDDIGQWVDTEYGIALGFQAWLAESRAGAS